MKKIIALFMVALMALSMTACGGKNDPKPSESGNSSASTQQSGKDSAESNGGSGTENQSGDQTVGGIQVGEDGKMLGGTELTAATDKLGKYTVVAEDCMADGICINNVYLVAPTDTDDIIDTFAAEECGRGEFSATDEIVIGYFDHWTYAVTKERDFHVTIVPTYLPIKATYEGFAWNGNYALDSEGEGYNEFIDLIDMKTTMSISPEDWQAGGYFNIVFANNDTVAGYVPIYWGEGGADTGNGGNAGGSAPVETGSAHNGTAGGDVDRQLGKIGLSLNDLSFAGDALTTELVDPHYGPGYYEVTFTVSQDANAGAIVEEFLNKAKEASDDGKLHEATIEFYNGEDSAEMFVSASDVDEEIGKRGKYIETVGFTYNNENTGVDIHVTDNGDSFTVSFGI